MAYVEAAAAQDLCEDTQHDWCRNWELQPCDYKTEILSTRQRRFGYIHGTLASSNSNWKHGPDCVC